MMRTVLAGLTAQRIESERTGIGELPVHLGHDIDESRLNIGLRADIDHAMFHAGEPRRNSRQSAFVERRVAKARDEGWNLRQAFEGGGDQCAIDVSAEQKADWHIADQLLVDDLRPRRIKILPGPRRAE